MNLTEPKPYMYQHCMIPFILFILFYAERKSKVATSITQIYHRSLWERYYLKTLYYLKAKFAGIFF